MKKFVKGWQIWKIMGNKNRNRRAVWGLCLIFGGMLFGQGCAESSESSGQKSKDDLLIGSWQIIELVVDGEKATPEQLGNTYMDFRANGEVMSYAKGDSVLDTWSLKGDTIVGSGKTGDGKAWIKEIDPESAVFGGIQNGFLTEMKARKMDRIPKSSKADQEYHPPVIPVPAIPEQK